MMEMRLQTQQSMKKMQIVIIQVRSICRTQYSGLLTVMAKPITTLELHFSMIQFLIVLTTRVLQPCSLIHRVINSE